MKSRHTAGDQLSSLVQMWARTLDLCNTTGTVSLDIICVYVCVCVCVYVYVCVCLCVWCVCVGVGVFLCVW